MRKRWLTLPMGPIVWTVSTAPPEDAFLEGNEAVTDPETSIVCMRNSMELTRIVGILGHELVHTALTNYNTETSAAMFHCRKKDVGDAEETIACLLGPPILGALYHGGYLKLPKMPR